MDPGNGQSGVIEMTIPNLAETHLGEVSINGFFSGGAPERFTLKSICIYMSTYRK